MRNTITRLHRHEIVRGPTEQVDYTMFEETRFVVQHVYYKDGSCREDRSNFFKTRKEAEEFLLKKVKDETIIQEGVRQEEQL